MRIFSSLILELVQIRCNVAAVKSTATNFGPHSCREDLAHELRQRISLGHLARGSALPGERELAERTGLARGTVRSALDQLQSEGLITCAHGRRRTVATADLSTQTLAILSNDPNPIPDVWHLPGLDAWLQIGLAQASYSRGWHVLNLHPRAVSVASGTSLPVAGMLVSTTAFDVPTTPGIITACRARGVAVCGVGDHPSLAESDRVVHDHAAGCRLLVEELLRRGVRRLRTCWGHRSHIDPWYLRARARGLNEAVRGSSVVADLPPWQVTPVDEDHDLDYEGRVMIEAAALAMPMRSAEPPEALLAVDDLHAILIAAALRRLGIEAARWPLITGYDATGRFNIPANEPEWLPDLSIDRGNPTIAMQAVAVISARLAGALPAGPQLQLVPPAALVSR